MVHEHNETNWSWTYTMTSMQQRAELQRRIWQIANDVRGAVDGWDFKQYVLGALFAFPIGPHYTYRQE